MRGTGAPEAAAPRRSAWALLTGLGGRHRLKLALTYAVTLAENGRNVRRPRRAAARAQGADAAQIEARVTLSRQVVDFLQTDVPAVAATLVHFVGAVAMLCVLAPWVGALAVLELLPIGLFTLWFGRASLRLNAALNDRLEREVALVARGSNAGVRRHFAHRLRFWRVRISDAEAKVWGGIEVVQIGLTLAALALLARESGVTAGAIYAVLAYVWTYGGSVSDVPGSVQKLSRLKDIASRLG